jgi:hypothetical protein
MHYIKCYTVMVDIGCVQLIMKPSFCNAVLIHFRLKNTEIALKINVIEDFWFTVRSHDTLPATHTPWCDGVES